MKYRRFTHEVLIHRSRRILAAVVVAAFALLLLAVIPRGGMKQESPRAQRGITQPQQQASLKPATQPEKPAAIKTAPHIVNKPSVKASSAASGMRVFIDPATGQLREPEAWEEQALSNQQLNKASREGRMNLREENQMTSGEPIYLPNGAVGMQLGEDQMNYSVARVNPDGSLSTECLPSKQAATQWLKNGAKNPPPVRKENLNEK